MGRIWLIANVAAEFHVLPTAVARDLDEDPERLSLLCLSFLRYAEAKGAEERSESESDLAAWKGSQLMERVLENKFALHKEKAEARKARASAEEERGKA